MVMHLRVFKSMPRNALCFMTSVKVWERLPRLSKKNLKGSLRGVVTSFVGEGIDNSS